MKGTALMSFPPLQEGILLKRYKRFLADIELPTGEIVTAHCANTGPMTGVLSLGGRVRLRYVASSTRKLAWTWEQAEIHGANGTNCWVGINTALPNRLIELAIKAGLLEQSFGSISQIRKEVPYGMNLRSRIDLLLSPSLDADDSREIYVEVKNTTWAIGSLALFPDTITERGQKHLRELVGVLPGSRGVLIPCLSRSDVHGFAPGDSADPIYGELFRKAVKAGVEVLPCCFGFHEDQITWEGMRPFQTNQ